MKKIILLLVSFFMVMQPKFNIHNFPFDFRKPATFLEQDFSDIGKNYKHECSYIFKKYEKLPESIEENSPVPSIGQLHEACIKQLYNKEKRFKGSPSDKKLEEYRKSDSDYNKNHPLFNLTKDDVNPFWNNLLATSFDRK